MAMVAREQVGQGFLEPCMNIGFTSEEDGMLWLAFE